MSNSDLAEKCNKLVHGLLKGMK